MFDTKPNGKDIQIAMKKSHICIPKPGDTVNFDDGETGEIVSHTTPTLGLPESQIEVMVDMTKDGQRKTFTLSELNQLTKNENLSET